VARFWDDRRGVFVINLPWLAEEPGVRLCDRSLATSVLYDQCPGGQTAAAVQVLAECPPEMGFSYPCNAGWRLWALGQAGRVDVVVRDLRQRWATMDSVALNNTLQENWAVRPDSPHQWSHCAVVPLYVAYHTLAGLRPLIPGFARVELRPQLGGLEDLDITAFTARGPIRLAARGRPGAREVTFELPATCSGELVLPDSETVSLVPRKGPVPAGCRRYDLPSGTTTLHLKSV
jgi:alpha-L-rhamnosidase